MTKSKRAAGKRGAVYEWWITEHIGMWVGKWTRTNRYHWHLLAANNEIVASGEGYTRKASVLRAIAAHRRNAATMVVRERR